MSTTPLSDLTDLQVRILGVLWSRGDSTISEIHESLADADMSTKTIGVLLSRLEHRKLVSHRIEGREGVYRVLVKRKDILVEKVGSLLESLFSGDDSSAGAAAVSRKEVKKGDAARLLSLLKKAEQDLKRSK